MELQELLDILSEQQQSLLLLADEQRELWASSLDTAFQQILRRHAGSSSPDLDSKVRLSIDSRDVSREGTSNVSVEFNREKPGEFPMRHVKPTLKPCVAEVDEELHYHWPLEAEKRDEPRHLVDLSTVREASNEVMSTEAEEEFQKRVRMTSSQSLSMRLTGTLPTSNHIIAHMVRDSEEEEDTWLRRGFNFVMKYLDTVASFLVFLNALVMLLEFEMSGRETGQNLGRSDGAYYSDERGIFRSLGITFDSLFAIELLLRIVASGWLFLQDVANMFDSVLVFAGLAEHFLLLIIPDDPLSSQLMRALSSIRAVRMLRAFRFSQGLKLLLNACQAFLMSLVWSMVLLGVVMVVASLMIGNLLQGYLQNDAVSLEDREFIWRLYGTAYRSWYTLYEITFAGNWPTMARPVLDKVSHGFVIFFVLYITVIVFALIRVITAVFLKDTLDAANNDAELRMADGLRKKAEYVEKLEGIFKAIDDGGDGMITEERLTYIMDNPKVKAYFQTLDVDVHEGAALFHILDDGDGECTLEEFIGGILRCKGPARAIDQVAMMADLRLLDKKLSKLIHALHDNSIIATLESGEFKPITPISSDKNRFVRGISDQTDQSHDGGPSVSKTQSRRRLSDAAQTFLYRTAMLPKLKHAASVQGEDSTTMLM